MINATVVLLGSKRQNTLAYTWLCQADHYCPDTTEALFNELFLATADSKSITS